MKIDYQEKLTPVIRYLEQNYNQSLNLTEVAALAHLSPFHFHRIFKIVTNETVAEYIRRLKLTNAAQMLFYKDHSVTHVALEFGFSSSQSLAKAFKNYFGLTPSDIKQCQTLCELSSQLRNSKIANTLSKRPSVNEAKERPALNSQYENTIMNTEVFDKRLLAYVRVTGTYGENYDTAITKLYQWAGAKGLCGGESIFIYHDNPDISPSDKCRTDICLSVPTGTIASNGIELQELPAGGYASTRRAITNKSNFGLFWDELLSQVVNSGLDTDNRPCFELYHHYDPETQQGDVSFYTAVKV